MAHHQHHGSNYGSHVSQTLSRPAASCSPSLNLVSEDELAAEADEPPDRKPPNFAKTMPRPRLGDIRRTESLLTKAFHTDSESHEDDHKLSSIISHNPSVSSACSTFSGRSAGDFTSDDGQTSPGTRASTPSSPRTNVGLSKVRPYDKSVPRISFPTRQASETTKSSDTVATLKPAEPALEAELGRKRCISFVCGRKDTATPSGIKVAAEAAPTEPEPPKKTCSIKFLCPSKALVPKPLTKEGHARPSRLHSPAPAPKSVSPANAKRGHRDSDATLTNMSPKSVSPAPVPTKARRSSLTNPARTEATRFHEFAGSDEEVEDWIRESTCHRSRLTVTDTLKKENAIRKLAEEAEEEALEEEEGLEEDEDDVDDTQTDFFSGEEEDAGFQTDDEEGFAESDDDSDDDSDYEWWAPRRSPTLSPFIPSNFFRPSNHRTGSNSSLDIAPDETPLKRRLTHRSSKHGKHVRPVAIRSASNELPDSTDFVCGTLDEDRPMEQAYLNNRKQREAAKHRPTPQDIDPTFPTSDPEVGKDEEEEEEVTDEEDEVDDVPDEHVSESDHISFMHGQFEGDHDEHRGRRHPIAARRSPHHSPRRLKSPPAPMKRGRSPATRGMFHGSPKRGRSPPVPNRPTSPPPSRRGSTMASPATLTVPTFGQTLLGTRNYDLTHTSSLPRSPHPFGRRRRSSNLTATPTPDGQSSDQDEEDNGSNNDKPYARGAIDIVQGLEQKRLKRREKLYKQYWKREEKKKQHRRPQPGKGAERMRQVGIECAIYRGKRVLSY